MTSDRCEVCDRPFEWCACPPSEPAIRARDTQRAAIRAIIAETRARLRGTG